MQVHAFRRKAVVLVGIGFGALMALAPGGAQARPACGLDSSAPLASDSYAAVYGSNDRAYVCVKATGKRITLKGASASQDHFALGGTWVAWSSGDTHSVVNVMHIPNKAIPNQFPFDTNDHIDKLVVKPDGAAAWAASPVGDNTYVQGMDRRNHEPDQLSDDTEDVVGSSLRSLAGHRISWKDTDGTTHTANLF